MTNRLSFYIIDKLRNEVSYSSVAREVNLSVSTVIRVFDLVSYAPKELPSAISIDEFKGNTNSETYQCILTDPVNKVVLDILPKDMSIFSLHTLTALISHSVTRYSFLSVICGNLLLTSQRRGLRTQSRS